MKSALVTGIAGQDGTYMARLLLQKGYKVFGFFKGTESQFAERVTSKNPDVKYIYGDMQELNSICKALKTVEPEEVYNFAGISFVGRSISEPFLTADVNGIGVLRLLEALRLTEMDLATRLYQASSSEIFGSVHTFPQDENFPCVPRSPYGSSKLFAHNVCRNYREVYGIYISCGITFNHESELRGEEYVTRKIVKGLAAIKLGFGEKIQIGDIDASRDWGFAGDYVKGMWLSLQQEFGDDYVFSTGKLHSVREIIQICLDYFGLENDISKYFSINKDYIRPREFAPLLGDSSKAKIKLGWEPTTSFEELVIMMCDSELQGQRKNK
jgi:GDPmannose 4,6-dehydratase